MTTANRKQTITLALINFSIVPSYDGANQEENAEGCLLTTSAPTHVKVAKAYTAQKHGLYERHGEKGLRQHEGGQQANPFDMFSSFFGGGGPQQQEVRRRPMTTSDFEVSLEDMYKGVEINFMINIKVFCDHFCVGGLAHPDVSHMLVPHMQHYALNVPMGIAEGSEFVFEGEGDESPDWEAGDIIIRVLGGKNKGG
ncbi:hypothetical protein JB92DRAFT_2835079 [Gautieria morchelliformis]|nr:hypothetical protein JB92DRAFT_2835079 [Gautieria morchelliformis]